MKKIYCLFSILLFITFSRAQVPDFILQTKQIAAMEQKANAWKLQQQPSGKASLTSNYDLKYHRCEWNVDPGVYYISGAVTSYFIPTTAGFSEIDFDLSIVMVVDSVKYHGSTLVYSQDEGDILAITLPSVSPEGMLDSVSVYYHGVPVGSGFGSFVQSTHSGIPIMWTLSEPYGAKDWWPCKQSLNDKIDSIDIYVTCPAQYRDGSNGVLVSETQNGNKKTYHWKSNYPIAAYLVAFAVTNYSQYSDYATLSNGNSLQILNYVYPEDLATAQSLTPALVPVIELYGSLTIDYPFANEKYGHCQFGWGGGMEHQTMTYCVAFDEWLIAHECAHQWFGDKVTCGSWQDIWLNEGFATYFEGLTQQNLYPAYWPSWKQLHLNYIVSDPNGSVFCTDTTSIGRIFDSRLSYSKGAYLLNMLRWKLGDTFFFEGLRQYLTDPNLAYGYAKTPDLKQHLEAVSGQNLTNFFNQWYYNQGYPTYNLKWYTIGNTAHFTLSQTQSNPSVAFFEMPVPVQLKDATHDTTVVLNNTFSGQTFSVNLGFVPSQVILDPELWILHANDMITETDTTIITTSPVAGSPFCPLASMNVSFNAAGHYMPGNTFTAQISNATGSFSNPAAIGTLASTLNSGTIPAMLPNNLAGGSLYRIRVVSSSPLVNGSNNGSDITVKGCGIPTGLTASNITKKTASITWNVVDCAVKYKLQYQVSGAAAWTNKSSVTNSFNLKGLSPNTIYRYKVSTLCSANGVSKSKFSAVKSFTTPLQRDAIMDEQPIVTEVNIFPNPAKNDFVIQVNSTKQGTAIIVIYNMVGENLISKTVPLEEGMNDVSFQVGDISPGIYLISVQTNEGKIIRKLTLTK